MELKGLRINFLGDSITEGHGASNRANCYVSLIAQDTGAICRNYGIGGTRIAKQSLPSDNPILDLDFCSRVGQMDDDADVVVVFGGTNDYGHGNAPLGKFEDRTADTFYGALHTLCISLIEKYPTSKIVIATPLHRTNELLPTAPDKLPLKSYVEAIRETAEYYSLPVLDLFKISGIQPNVQLLKMMYMPDGLHPNDDGYKILAKTIISFLKAL